MKVGNLAPRRDLTCVEDAVEGFIRAEDHPRSVGRAINLGTGRDVSIGDLLKSISKRLGITPRVVVGSQRKRVKSSEVERLCAAVPLARSLVRWRSKASLSEGLRRMIAWNRDNSRNRARGGYSI